MWYNHIYITILGQYMEKKKHGQVLISHSFYPSQWIGIWLWIPVFYMNMMLLVVYINFFNGHYKNSKCVCVQETQVSRQRFSRSKWSITLTYQQGLHMKKKNIPLTKLLLYLLSQTFRSFACFIFQMQNLPKRPS